jgi:hypothetical protein
MLRAAERQTTTTGSVHRSSVNCDELFQNTWNLELIAEPLAFGISSNYQWRNSLPH